MATPLNFLVESSGVTDRFVLADSPSLSSSDSHRETESETTYFSVRAALAGKSDGNNNNSSLLSGLGKLDFDHGCEAESSIINLTNDDGANLASWLSPDLLDDATSCLRNLALTNDWLASEQQSFGMHQPDGLNPPAYGSAKRANSAQSVTSHNGQPHATTRRAITGTAQQFGTGLTWQASDATSNDNTTFLKDVWPSLAALNSLCAIPSISNAKSEPLSRVPSSCTVGKPSAALGNGPISNDSSAFESAVGRALASVILNGDTDATPIQSHMHHSTAVCEKQSYAAASRNTSANAPMRHNHNGPRDRDRDSTVKNGISTVAPAHPHPQLGVAELAEMIRAIPNAVLRNTLTQLLFTEAQQPASHFAGTIRALIAVNQLDAFLNGASSSPPVANGALRTAPNNSMMNDVSNLNEPAQSDSDLRLLDSIFDTTKARAAPLSDWNAGAPLVNASNASHGWSSAQGSRAPTNSRGNLLGTNLPLGASQTVSAGTGSTLCSSTIGIETQACESVEAKRFSRKVFVGGLPPDVDEAEIGEAFRRFGALVVDWPHKVETKSRFPPKGYCFLIFQDESSVRALIKACIVDDSKLYWLVSSSTVREKPVQIRPWNISDSDFVLDDSQPLDPRKTIFVGGVPRPLRASELALIMNRLYGGVCYAGIDTDPELKYPKGAGRVAFANQQSYVAAISARFVQLHLPEIDKRVEVKPYVLDDQYCDECGGTRCGGKFAPFFCANITCLQYYCEQCWTLIHAKPGREYHKPLIKDGADRPRAPFRW